MPSPSVTERRHSPLLPRPKPVPPWLWQQFGRITGIDRLERLYRQLPAAAEGLAFIDAALSALDVDWTLPADEAARIPRHGPIVIAANHPYGGIDGLATIAALLRFRPDLRVVATQGLGEIEALKRTLIAVDNFGSKEAAQKNILAVRRALRHVWSGGALLMFPAGEVAHLDLNHRCVVDPPWKRSALSLLRLAKAPVLPLYVHGSNGMGFQLAGLLHPSLRTLLLPREVTNKRGTRLDLRLGTAVTAERIGAIEHHADLERLLRIRLYSLAAPRPDEQRTCLPAHDTTLEEPIAPQGDPQEIADEIGSLPSSCKLTELGPLHVYAVVGHRIPRILAEIGRLREITFRSVGEGTGRARDLDRFDHYYEHLFAWDTRKNQLVGAYRMARIDQVRRQYGRKALYLSTLFEISEPFFGLLGPALELGRSFVRAEYQRGLTPLMALWAGIAEFVSRHPRYAKLLGPVSISADYDQSSRELLVRYLRWHHFDPLLGALLKPRTPFRPAGSLGSLNRELATLARIDDLAKYWPDEHQGRARAVPVLLRQYLKLGGRVVGFNVDPAFGNCLDCLTIVDLRRTPDEVLGKYMAPESLSRFRNHAAGRTIRQSSASISPVSRPKVTLPSTETG